MIGLEALGHEAGDHVGLAGQLVLDHALGVDRIEHGLTHTLVVERLLLGVEHDERLIEAIHRLDVGAGGLQGVERLAGTFSMMSLLPFCMAVTRAVSSTFTFHTMWETCAGNSPL